MKKVANSNKFVSNLQVWFSYITVKAMLLLFVILPYSECHSANSKKDAGISDDYYPYRFTLSVTFPAAGDYQLDLTAEKITNWVNEHSLFKFDKKFFGYANVKLLEVGKKGSLLPVGAGFYLDSGKELLKNGNFERLNKKDFPAEWRFSTRKGFNVKKESGNSFLVVEGSDMNNAFQIIPTQKDTWYRFSYRGSASVAPYILRKNVKGLRVVDRSYPTILPEAKGKWTQTEYFTFTGDKSGWQKDLLCIRVNRFSGKADDISFKEYNYGFVIKAKSAGTKKYVLLYSPVEGMVLSPPSNIIKSLPVNTLKATRNDKGKNIDEEECHTLVKTQSGTFWTAPTTKKINPSMKPAVKTANFISIACAKNESEPIQLIFTPSGTGEIKNIAVSLIGPDGKALSESSFDVRRARYVKISTPSDYMGGAGYMIAKRNQFIGLLPDPLPKFGPVSYKDNDKNILLWVDISVPANATPGKYKGTITIETSSGTSRIPLKLKVWNFSLPDTPTCKTALGLIRYNNAEIFPFHKVTSKEDKWLLTRKYIAELSHYKMNARNPFAAGVLNPKGPGTKYNRKVPNAIIKMQSLELPWTKEKLRINTFAFGHFSGWMKKGAGKKGKKMGRYYDLIARFLKKEQIIDKGYIIVDEPRPVNYPWVKKFINEFRKFSDASKIKFFTYTYHINAYKRLADVFNILAFYNGEDNNYCVVQQSMKTLPKDVEGWCYYTRTAHLWIDSPGINHRLLGAKVWNNGGKGFSHFGMLCWDTPGINKEYNVSNPWQNPYSFVGNGTCAIFYPPSPAGKEIKHKDMNIVPSLRLLLLRDGIEDYEYAVKLEKLIAEAKKSGKNTKEAEKILKAMRRMFTSPVSWSVGEKYWRKTRAKAAEAIVRLLK